MGKPLVFISHIAEEREIALALQDLVNGAFPDLIEAFVSSSPKSIGLGIEWLDSITSALKRCEITIILASPTSVKRPWINFEAGAVWSRNKPVIPLCHSGMTKSKLPYPLAMLQAGTITDEQNLQESFALMASTLGIAVPNLDFSQFIEKVRRCEIAPMQDLPSDSAPPASIAAPPNDGLTQSEVKLLLAIADTSNEGIQFYSLQPVGEKAGLTKAGTTVAYNLLINKKLIDHVRASGFMGSGMLDRIRVSRDGWNWLGRNEHVLDRK